MSERFQILSLDGGGLKGLFSAAVLAHLEEDLDVRITDHFDLIAGTSTGGIIALALGYGMRPREVVQFYLKNGARIFPPRRFGLLRQFRCSKYEPSALEQCLKECFGDRRLADSQKRLVIPSYSLGTDNVYLFKTPHHERLKRDWRVPMWQVAMATSAAPTFLPAFTQVDKQRLIDGGVWANNPVMVAVVEAASMLEVPLSAMRVLSLGTTDSIKGRSPKLDRGGFWQWKQDGSEVFLRGQSIGAFNQALHLLDKERAIRLDPVVPDGLFQLDKLSEDGLTERAATVSRDFTPRYERTFAGHQAAPYTSLYPPRG